MRRINRNDDCRRRHLDAIAIIDFAGDVLPCEPFEEFHFIRCLIAPVELDGGGPGIGHREVVEDEIHAGAFQLSGTGGDDAEPIVRAVAIVEGAVIHRGNGCQLHIHTFIGSSLPRVTGHTARVREEDWGSPRACVGIGGNRIPDLVVVKHEADGLFGFGAAFKAATKTLT